MISFIVFAPFGLFSAYIIPSLRFRYKGAILGFLCHLHISDSQGDFPECHFRNIARCNTEGVNGGRGIKIDNILKILTVKKLARVQTAAADQHKSNAVCCQPLIYDLYIEIVQFF
ncbi:MULTISPECIES: hypothetical protein [Clostridia]|uniref:hypothetical protein n=1 Tax=Blautia intestinalis TaxID=2763028 RepID=UPI001FAA889E|nr:MULTISPECIES: hypothetical protein [Clostridia]